MLSDASRQQALASPPDSPAAAAAWQAAAAQRQAHARCVALAYGAASTEAAFEALELAGLLARAGRAGEAAELRAAACTALELHFGPAAARQLVPTERQAA